MSQLTLWKENLCRWLATAEELQETDILPEFSPRLKPVPVRRPRIAVGFESLTAGEEAWEEYREDTGQTDARPVEAVLRLELLVPTSAGGSSCHTLWEALCHRLLFSHGEYQVEKLWCKPISFDKEAGGYRLTAWAQVELVLTQPSEVTRYSQVEVRRERI